MKNIKESNSFFADGPLVKSNYACITLYRNLLQGGIQAAELSRLTVSIWIKSAFPAVLNSTFMALKVPADMTVMLPVKH
jgi:hypothetical protein